MKALVLFVSLGLIATQAMAQKVKPEEVPAGVKKAFADKFTVTKNVKWEKEGEEFEASFEANGKEQTAVFSNSGQWKETETEIKESALPAAVKATLAKEFAGYKVDEIESIEAPGKNTFYELEAEKGKTAYEVQFSADGKILKKEEKKD